jgi:hypothetical protein
MQWLFPVEGFESGDYSNLILERSLSKNHIKLDENNLIILFMPSIKKTQY